MGLRGPGNLAGRVGGGGGYVIDGWILVGRERRRAQHFKGRERVERRAIKAKARGRVARKLAGAVFPVITTRLGNR